MHSQPKEGIVYPMATTTNDPEFLASLQNLAELAGYTPELHSLDVGGTRHLSVFLAGDSPVTFFREVLKVAFNEHVLFEASFEDSRGDCVSSVIEAMHKVKEHNGWLFFPGLEYVKEA